MSRWVLSLLLLCAAALLAGCASFEQQSDWQWQQMAPTYRPLPGDYPR